MTEQQKEKLESEVLKYMGKTLKKEGETNGNAWKIWKLEFDTGGQYPWKVSAFDKLSDKGVQVKDMQEGQFYEVVYKHTSFTHPQYGEVKSKQAVLIKLSTADKATTGMPQQQQQRVAAAPSLPGSFALRDWPQFAQEFENIKAELANETCDNEIYMLGLYIANHYAKEAEAIIQKVKEHFAQ